jgi:hypothetical protein
LAVRAALERLVALRKEAEEAAVWVQRMPVLAVEADLVDVAAEEDSEDREAARVSAFWYFSQLSP